MSKSHPGIFNIVFIFQNQHSACWGGGGAPFVGSESDTIKYVVLGLGDCFMTLVLTRRVPLGLGLSSLLASLPPSVLN